MKGEVSRDRILLAFERYETDEMTHTQLLRAMGAHVDRVSYANAVDALIADGVIDVLRERTAGRPRDVYFLKAEA